MKNLDVHFDEAWYAYAKFHPIYEGRFAMGVEEKRTDDLPMLNMPTLFAVQSTHKMLPAFSMASMIHIKYPERADVRFDQFNEAFMMHGTTSPFYPMIASIDVATSMMDEPGGPTMMKETVLDAIGLRKAIASVAEKYEKKGSQKKDPWFFGCYQPDKVLHDGNYVDFVDAPDSELATNPNCWKLQRDPDKPDFAWHGFKKEDLGDDDGYCMLDPTKVTILCPGINPQGKMSEWGIPGAILTRFLDSRRIEIARTGDYTVLVLFSVGSSKGKWGTLLEALMEFKSLYDGGATLYEVLPELVAEFPDRYSLKDGNPMTLKDLCQEMHEAMKKSNLPAKLNNACDKIPQAVLSPAETYQKLVRNKTELQQIDDDAVGRISGHMLVPYPPGIPIIMPGEPLEQEHVDLLFELQEFGKDFPGFGREIHGIEVDGEGNFWMRCVIEDEERVSTAPSFMLKARPRAVMKSFKKGRS